MLQGRRKDVIWCLMSLLASTAGDQSTSVYFGVKETQQALKFSVFGKDKALPNFSFPPAGVYPGRLLVQAHQEGVTAEDVLSGRC